MSNLVHFKPQAEWDAAANLAEFIRQCREELTVFGGVDWSSWQWEGVIQFTKLGINSRTAAAKADPTHWFNPEFMDFSKAYFRYQQGHNPTGTKNEIKALRALEAALTEMTGIARISDISTAALDEAARIARTHYSKATAYHAGRELERLAAFVSDKSLVASSVGSWRNPIPRAQDRNRVGKKAREIREKRLPNEDALIALAEIFANNPTDPRDIFTSSTFAMTMCASVRISEILELPVDCEVEEADRKGEIRYGWRFYSGKGFGANIKWIPTVMVPVARTAVARIRKLTEPARKLAKWIEQHPNEFFPHPNCPRVPAEKPLSAEQIGLALGWKGRGSGFQLRKLMPEIRHGKMPSLSSLWEYVMSRQPPGFPWLSEQKRVLYSDALFCMTVNRLHTTRGTSPVILWAPEGNVFNQDLSPREALKNCKHQSIFDRHGYKGADGRRLKLTSHQSRHLLDTLAQRGGLSQDQIARWAGRADPLQNRTYNHMSEFELVARAEALDTTGTLYGPIGEVGKHPPITIQEFNALEKGPVKVTEFGICVHDYTMSPCEKYRDCINCEEQVCIKGDQERLARIRNRLAEVEEQYRAAEQAIAAGESGADRWYEHHANTLARLRELVAILEDPSIKDGALIKRRSNTAFSPLRRAVEAKRLEASEGQVAALENLRTLLGGGLG